MIAARLLGFIEALRNNGVRAAGSEVIDAMAALVTLEDGALADRLVVRSALSATLAKSEADEETFDRVFSLHFDRDLDAQRGPPLAELLRQRGVNEEDIEALLRALASEDAVLAALLAGDAERLTEAVRTAVDDADLTGLQSSLQVAYFTQRLMQRLGLGALESRFAEARALLRARSGPTDDHARDALDRAAAGGQWDLLERLRRSARRAVERELQKRTVARPRRTGALLERDLRAVDAGEIEELRALVRRLAEKLKARLIARRRRAGRGRIDPRRTLRRSIGTDAIPFRIELCRRRPARPELVVLCDISDSVRQTSLFMLELIAAISDVLKRSRSFVFVDRVAEVTALFQEGRRASAADPVERILAGDVIAVGASSDYGKSLRAFWDAHGGSLSRRSTVVILGDGRGNYRPPEEWVLAEIRRRSRRLLWLSPEERGTWGFGDSEMPRYARHADAIHVVRTAADLSKAVDRLTR